MSKTYTITAGNNSTDLGVVGHADTYLGAKRIGRKAVREMLPDGQGSYTIKHNHMTFAESMEREERSIRTGNQWLKIAA